MSDTRRYNASSGDPSIDTDAFVESYAAVKLPEHIEPRFYDCQKYQEQTMSDITKHTPGPWEYRKMPQSGYIVFQTWDVPTAGYVKTGADARLIAAAPEMLEALKECAEYIGKMPHPDFVNGERIDLVHGGALQVIAKAEGRTP